MWYIIVFLVEPNLQKLNITYHASTVARETGKCGSSKLERKTPHPRGKYQYYLSIFNI